VSLPTSFIVQAMLQRTCDIDNDESRYAGKLVQHACIFNRDLNARGAFDSIPFASIICLQEPRGQFSDWSHRYLKVHKQLLRGMSSFA